MDVGPLDISPTGRAHTRTASQGDIETTALEVKPNGTLTGSVSESTPNDGCDSGPGPLHRATPSAAAAAHAARASSPEAPLR